MTFFRRLLLVAALVTLVAGSLLAQSVTTGAISGTVTQDGAPLPGVTVSINSPQLLGTRTTVTNEAGGYNFGAVPPGDYTVSFALEGLQTVTRTQRVGVAQTARVDADMRLAAVQEAITVTASAPAVAETQEIQANFTAEEITQLPVARTIVAVTLLAPGVSNNGVNGLSISGGMSYDNLYTVNGAVIQENLRGQPHNLFIEDAIQETTIQSGAISAEYGNFTGGVVNAITKSGGNEFTGSLRDSLTNPAWTREAPDTFVASGSTVTAVQAPENIDKLNHQYEATLGGYILRDRLWFFTAGRYAKRESTRFFSNSGGSFIRGSEDQRLEAKLTGAITPQHNLIFSYMDSPTSATNDCQIGCYDASQLDPEVENPTSFMTAFYNGVITNNLLIEAKYSKKDYAFVGYGGESQDRITGTPIRLLAPGFSTIVNEAFFCGTCGDEIRDNDSVGLKGTYFLGTRSLGSHNLVAGIERWHETRLANNYQTSSLFQFVARTLAPKRDANGMALVSIKGGNDYIQYRPILVLSQGSDLNTDSFYINDRWDLNARWQFNIGARYDKNDSTDSSGQAVANDSKISPRVGLSFDPFANGRLRMHAGYGVYVGRLADTIAGLGSAAGNTAAFSYLYGGPDIIDTPAEEALRQVWAWFDSIGGYDKAQLIGQSIPGASNQVLDSLTSPNVKEYTVGASTTLGRGFVRVDFIDRNWDDFYDLALNLGTGRVTLPSGSQADRGLVVNNADGLERKYQALQLQTQYRAMDRLNVGLNYTLSRLEANIVGETSGAGPVVFGSPSIYLPEYYDWPGGENAPVGPADLEDQTHKLRAWASFDLPTPVGNFNVSALQRFESGMAYGLFGSIDVRQSANFYGTGQAGGIANPGYLAATIPSSVTYWFEEPGSRRWDDYYSTDLALNYNTDPAWLRGASVFVEGEILNIFNNDAQTGGSGVGGGNRAVLTHLNDSTLKRFNPMAGDKPVLGTHYRYGPLFGLPTSSTNGDVQGHFQLPRTYRVSLGLRF